METLFAEIKDGIVVRVIVVDPKNAPDEAAGIAFCQRLLGGEWKQTYPDGHKRKRYAGIGYSFNEQRDAFIPPKPYNSWVLDDDCNWIAPKTKPVSQEGKLYSWDEDTQEWIKKEVDLITGEIVDAK